jgi:hypothetical protein
MEYRLNDTELIKAFIYGGKAEFVIKSAASGKHWVFKIQSARDDARKFFVRQRYYESKLGDEFNYIGLIYDNTYRAKVRDKSEQIISHLLNFLQRGELHPQFEFYHIGRCSRCSRPLTNPTSIQRGMGDYCASKS